MSRAPGRVLELTEQECRKRLATHAGTVGRIAFAEDRDPDWPTVLVVNYAYRDGHVFVRTYEGSKLYAALRHQRVAFEIDAVDAQWSEGWSVVAVGVLELVEDPDEREAAGAVVDSWGAHGARYLVRIDIERLSGREIVGGAGRRQ